MRPSQKIVYLDQCAIRNLIQNSEKDSSWKELLLVLKKGVADGGLICPLPPETIVESTSSDRVLRMSIRDLQWELSGGLAFKFYSQIVAEEILALVRPSFTPDPYTKFAFDNTGDDFLSEIQSRDFKKGKATADKMNADFVHPAERKTCSIEEVQQGIRLEQMQSFYQQIERLMSGRELDSTKDLFLEECRFLLTKGVTDNELKNIKHAIIHHRVEAVPCFFYNTQLGAQIEYEGLKIGRKLMARDQIDIFRLAVGLSASDLIITDSPMATLCKNAHIEKYSDTVVFSVKQIPEITKTLADF